MKQEKHKHTHTKYTKAPRNQIAKNQWKTGILKDSREKKFLLHENKHNKNYNRYFSPDIWKLTAMTYL